MEGSREGSNNFNQTPTRRSQSLTQQRHDHKESKSRRKISLHGFLHQVENKLLYTQERLQVEEEAHNQIKMRESCYKRKINILEERLEETLLMMERKQSLNKIEIESKKKKIQTLIDHHSKEISRIQEAHNYQIAKTQLQDQKMKEKYKMQINDLSKQYQHLVQERLSEQKAMDEKINQLYQKNKEVINSAKQMDGLRKQNILELKDKIKNIQQQRNNLKIQLRNKSRQICLLKQGKEIVQDNLLTELNHLKGRMTEQKNEYSRYQNYCSTQAQELHSLQKEKIIQQHDIEMIKVAEKKKNEEMQKYKKLIDDLSEQVSIKTQQINKNKTLLIQSKKQSEILLEQNKKFFTKLHSLSKQIKQLQQRLIKEQKNSEKEKNSEFLQLEQEKMQWEQEKETFLKQHDDQIRSLYDEFDRKMEQERVQFNKILENQKKISDAQIKKLHTKNQALKRECEQEKEKLKRYQRGSQNFLNILETPEKEIEQLKEEKKYLEAINEEMKKQLIKIKSKNMNQNYQDSFINTNLMQEEERENPFSEVDLFYSEDCSSENTVMKDSQVITSLCFKSLQN